MSHRRPIPNENGWKEFEDVPELTAQELHLADGHDRQMLRIVLEVLKADRGSATPAENFVSSLIHLSAHFSLTPADVERELETFHWEFRMMRETSAYFLQRYPELAGEEQKRVDRKRAEASKQDRDDAPKPTPPAPPSASQPKGVSKPHPIYANQTPKGDRLPGGHSHGA